MSEVDTRQEGGAHYKKCPPEFQHWNLVLVHGWDYFQAAAIKYIMRYKDKEGAKDLRKALHFVEKMLDTLEGKVPTIEAPKVADFYQYVKPTGWIKFVFEGATDVGFLYTCEGCKAKIYAAPFQPPWDAHTDCPAIGDPKWDVGDATSDYVSQ